MAAIAFVGDSFCAAYGMEDWKSRGCPGHQHGTFDPTFVSHVVTANNYDLYPFGYGGKSWWYSRQQFVDALKNIPSDVFENQLEVIVFCHTNCDRINNSWNFNLTNVGDDKKIYAPVESYYKHIHDRDFNAWAQRCWFSEINQRWSQIKTIHFHCFTDSLQWADLLPGVNFITPLVYISMGELTGTDLDLHMSLQNETRHNHLNTHNNLALGNIILKTISNYQPGQYQLPMQDFDIVNPNATRFPNPGHGTK
jgi:hypothetical protein